MPESPAAIVWCEPSHASFAHDLCESLGVRVIAAGTPAGNGFGDAFEDATKIDDIRHALLSTDADLALLATARTSPDEAAGALLDDAEFLRDAKKRLRTIVTTCPAPGRVELAPLPGETDRFPARFVPRFNTLASFSDARETLETFESVRSVSFASRCAPAHGALGARLLDAMLTVHSVLGVPERIDAAVITPQHTAGIHRASPETLAELTGDLTANLRYAGPRAASVTLSDRGGRWFRGAALIGEHGCVRIDDDSFERIDEHGATVDSTSAPASGGASGGASDDPAVRAMARQIAAAMDPRTPLPPQQDLREVLAMCHAAILSARTGEPEAPSTILRLAKAV